MQTGQNQTNSLSSQLSIIRTNLLNFRFLPFFHRPIRFGWSSPPPLITSHVFILSPFVLIHLIYSHQFEIYLYLSFPSPHLFRRHPFCWHPLFHPRPFHTAPVPPTPVSAASVPPGLTVTIPAIPAIPAIPSSASIRSAGIRFACAHSVQSLPFRRCCLSHHPFCQPCPFRRCFPSPHPYRFTTIQPSFSSSTSAVFSRFGVFRQQTKYVVRYRWRQCVVKKYFVAYLFCCAHSSPSTSKPLSNLWAFVARALLVFDCQEWRIPIFLEMTGCSSIFKFQISI